MIGDLGCFVRIALVGIERENFGCCAISMAVRAGVDSKQPVPRQTGVARLEKFSQVKLLQDGWRTAPNHSRPASCVVDADIDAEDQPADLNPQKGH